MPLRLPLCLAPSIAMLLIMLSPAHAQTAGACNLGEAPVAPSVSCSSIETALDELAVSLGAEGFSGSLFSPAMNTTLYDAARTQYASVTFPDRVRPSFIAQVETETDVQAAVLFASQCLYTIGVRSGGHSYLGLSSCDSSETPCLQIHLKLMNSHEVLPGKLKVGPGMTLEEFAEVLDDNGRFVPTGECAKIGLGGHVQTGGFGMWSRHFGPAAHNVDAFRIVLADGSLHNVVAPTFATSQLNNDLFYAVLGGASGSWGVVTEIVFKTISNEEFFSVWWEADILWEVEGVSNMFRKWAELAAQDEDDLRWSFHSSGVGILPSGLGPNYVEFQASWVGPVAEAGDYDPAWFQSILDACTNCVFLRPPLNITEPLSKSLKDRSVIASDNGGSFFPMPFQHYEKRWLQTSSLPTPDQIESLVRAVDGLMPDENSTHLYVTQFSTGIANGNPATNHGVNISMPWNDKFGLSSDLYYPTLLLKPVYEPLQNSMVDAFATILGENHQVFWAAWGGGAAPNITADWELYYDSENKFNRLRAIKGCVDPDNHFKHIMSMPVGEDVDECAASDDDCGANSVCTNTLGSFLCRCAAGYIGDAVAGCTDIDECTATPSPCAAAATCANTAPGYSCTCNDGYEGDGFTCTAVATDVVRPSSWECGSEAGVQVSACVAEALAGESGSGCALASAAAGKMADCFVSRGCCADWGAWTEFWAASGEYEGCNFAECTELENKVELVARLPYAQGAFEGNASLQQDYRASCASAGGVSVEAVQIIAIDTVQIAARRLLEDAIDVTTQIQTASKADADALAGNADFLTTLNSALASRGLKPATLVSAPSVVIPDNLTAAAATSLPSLFLSSLLAASSLALLGAF